MDKEEFDEQSKGTKYQQTRTIDADILEAETAWVGGGGVEQVLVSSFFSIINHRR